MSAPPIVPGQRYASRFMPGYTLVDVFTSYKFDNGVGARRDGDQSVRCRLHASAVDAVHGCVRAVSAATLPGCNDTVAGARCLFTAKAQF